jgi:glycosyltransferase involved in cell wall biosynthesis
MHDLNHSLGFVHYPYELKIISNPNLSKLEKKLFDQKKELYSKNKVQVICNSLWTYKTALASGIFPSDTKFHLANCSYSKDEYYPIEKDIAKQALGLSTEKAFIGFGSINNNCSRKGFQVLIDAVKMINRNHNTEVITFGSINLKKFNLSIVCHEYGKIESISIQRLLYSAMDIFVIPSIEEAFGLAALEAQACGTAVVGFKDTGVSDIIKEGENGELAENSNINDLAEKIKFLIENPKVLNEYQSNAVYNAKRFTLEKQSENFMKIFNSIM